MLQQLTLVFENRVGDFKFSSTNQIAVGDRAIDSLS